MPKINIQGVGLVDFPDNMSQDDIVRAIERDIIPGIKKTPVEPPKTGFIPSVIRGGKQLGSLVGDVLPAMVGKAVGAEDYSKKQMEEYAATQKEIQEKYPARVPSYKDIHSFGDAIDYAVESVGELIPSMLPSLITGGIGGVAARTLTAGAQAAAKKELMKTAVQAAIKSGAYGGQKETLAAINSIAKDAALKYVTRGQMAGAALGSAAQNIPEVYQNVYEATDGKIGSKEFAVALGGGLFNTALDTVLPATLLKKITGAGLDPAEVGMAWYKRLAKGAPKGFMQEGATETVQEMSSAAAENFVNENKKFFTEANFERFINAGLKGGLGGGVATGVTDVAVGKRPERKLDEKAKDLIEKTLEEAKVSDQEQEKITTDIAKAASFEELAKKVKNVNKKIEENEELSDKKKAELKDNIDEVVNEVAPPAITLTNEAKELLDIADTGAIPTRTDKQLKTIAKQNGVTFNPATDTVEDLIVELRKLGVQDAERRDLEASGAGADVSGKRGAGDTAGAEELDGTRVGGDEGATVTDQAAARDQQFALEFNNWLAEKDISLASLDEQQFLDLEAQFEQERGGKEVIDAERFTKVQVGTDANSWVNQNAQIYRSIADKSGLTEQIEELAARGLTASQITDSLKSKLEKLKVDDPKGFVVGVRATLGIPSIDEKEEFAAWLAKRKTSKAEEEQSALDLTDYTSVPYTDPETKEAVTLDFNNAYIEDGVVYVPSTGEFDYPIDNFSFKDANVNAQVKGAVLSKLASEPQKQEAAPVVEEDEVVEETQPVSNRGKKWAQESQAYRQQQTALSSEIDADDTLSKEEKKSAKAFNNYMVVADGDPKRALDLLAADLYDGSAFNKNPFQPNTGGFAAKSFYESLNPTNKQIVDERVAFLKKQEERFKAQAEARKDREAALAEERKQYESDENALMRRTQIFGHTTKQLIARVFLGDTRGALQEIAQGKGFSQLDQMIAKRILNSKTFPAIEIVPAETLVDEQGRQASGQYVVGKDTAQIAEGQVDSHSVLHEVSHGYLHALIRDFQAGRIENKGLTQLNDLYTFLKNNHPELAGQYGMGDLSEFASEVMSNPDFQAQLSKIPYQRVNAFTAFAQAVLRIMGISPTDKATALAAGLIAIDKSLATGRLYQDNEVTGKVVMPSPKVIKAGEEADVEGLAGVATGAKKLPREKQTYAQAKEGLRKDVESKEGAPQVKKIFTTREGWHWFVRKFQNSREVLKRIQKAMAANGLLISQGANRNDVAAQFDLSSALAETNYNEKLMPLYKDINSLAASYAKAAGLSFEEAMAELHLYAELKHEPERRHVLYLLNVPMKDDAAAIRKEILATVSELKGTKEEREAQAKQLRQLLEDLASDKQNLKDPLSNENQDRYNVIADRSVDEVNSIRAEQMANPKVANHLKTIDAIMVKLQEVNKATSELNEIGNYWSLPVDNIVKFYDYKNYVPFKGRPDQATVNDLADPFSKRLAGDLSEGQDAMQGRATEAENIILRTMAEGVKGALRAGRKDLTLAIKNAVAQGYLKGKINSKTGGKPVSFAERYILGKSIQEIKGETNIFHYNDDGSIDVISLTDPEQREAIRRTFKESHPFVDMLNSFTSGMGQLHTRYNPAFGPINFAGDLLTNAFTMGAEFGPKVTFDLLKTVATQVGTGGLYKAGKAAFLYNQGRMKELAKYTDPKSSDYDPFYANLVEYLERGGKVAYVQGFATKSQTDLARAEMRRHGKVVTKADIDKVVDVWTDSFELASRTAAYTVAKQLYLQENAKKGMEPATAEADAKSRATYYAKNLANFEQVGDYGKTLGALYMFARPAATGAVRAIEALQPLMMKYAGMELTAQEKQQAAHAQKMLIGLAGMGYAAYMMSLMMADDDDEGRNRTATDDMDRWVRYMRFPLPKWMTGKDDVIFQTRWGFGLGAFASAGAQVAGIVHGSSSVKKGLENIVEVGLDSFLPLPISRISITDNPAAWFMDSATPSAFRPFMEYVMNVDSLGREIYNNRQSRVGDAYTGGDNIPEGYKSAARMLFDITQGGMDVSPNTLYFFASNYLDGAMKMANAGYNLGLVATGEKDFNPKTDTVLFDSFFGSPSNFDAREFSEAEKKIKELDRRLKTLEKDPENYFKFIDANPDAPVIVDYYNQAVNGDLKDLRQFANVVRADRNLSPKERNDTVKDIVRMQNMVKRAILNNFEAMDFKP